MNINIWVTYIVGGAILLLLATLAVLLIINADQRATIAGDDAAKSMLTAQNRDWAQKAAATDAALARIRTADAANAAAIKKAQKAAAAAEQKLTAEAGAIADFSFGGSECDEVMAVKQAYMEHLQ
jgi:hypothetical protein